MVDQNHLVNIARAIEKGTRVATLDELKAKGQSSFKVINAAKIMELIKEAVDMAVDSMAGQKLTINLKDGTGVMEGRVTTTFVPGGN